MTSSLGLCCLCTAEPPPAVPKLCSKTFPLWPQHLWALCNSLTCRAQPTGHLLILAAVSADYFGTSWTVFFPLSQGQMLAEQKSRDEPLNHISSSSSSNSSVWSIWAEYHWNYFPSFSKLGQIYSLSLYFSDPLSKLCSWS